MSSCDSTSHQGGITITISLERPDKFPDSLSAMGR